MPETTLEELLRRIEALERLVQEQKPPAKDWRRAIGMFANDEHMKEIEEEGRKIREAEREAARREPQE